MLRASLEEVRCRQPFVLRAWVLLPDHGHFIWSLPPGDDDYVGRWDRLKTGFTRRLLSSTPGLSSVDKEKNTSEMRIWQRRFMSYRIRDPEEFSTHLDYLHYNPVKHGIAASVKAWRFSSFHTYVKRGVYGIHWGEAAPTLTTQSVS